MNLEAAHFVFYGALIASVILHEISHGVVALIYGDDTAKRAGRLTLNPIPHIDPLGSIILPGFAILAQSIAGIPAPVLGWAKPVPVNPARLRKPRQQMLFVGLVGPFTNFTLMMLAALAARAVAPANGVYGFDDPGITAFEVFWLFAMVNLFLGLFNLLPIPPLDGSSLIERVLPSRFLPTWWKIRPYGFLIIFVGLFYFRVFETIMLPFARMLARFVL